MDASVTLGGDRPSQTAHLAGSSVFDGVRAEIIKERYFKVDSTTPKHTLGTFFSPRMRRADIEVPNLAVDVNSWAR